MKLHLTGIVALAIAAGGIAAPAAACPSLSDEMERRVAEAHQRARWRADAVVIGTWRDLSAADVACGRSEGGVNLCKAEVVPEKVSKGPSLEAFPVGYDHFLNMCDARGLPPGEGRYGRFYLSRAADGSGFSLIEFVEMRRK